MVNPCLSQADIDNITCKAVQDIYDLALIKEVLEYAVSVSVKGTLTPADKNEVLKHLRYHLGEAMSKDVTKCLQECLVKFREK